MIPAPSHDELDRLEASIDAWLRSELEANPSVAAVDRGEAGERRWYVRLLGEEKDTFTIWFVLRQRSLHFEAYFCPAPEDNAEAFYAHLLRRNTSLRGMAFSIGDEDAVFLQGQLLFEQVDGDALDRVLGSVWAAVEQCFRPALRIGFARRLAAGA